MQYSYTLQLAINYTIISNNPVRSSHPGGSKTISHKHRSFQDLLKLKSILAISDSFPGSSAIIIANTKHFQDFISLKFNFIFMSISYLHGKTNNG